MHEKTVSMQLMTSALVNRTISNYNDGVNNKRIYEPGVKNMNNKLVSKSIIIIIVWLGALITGSIFTQYILIRQINNLLMLEYVQMAVMYLFVIEVLFVISKILELDYVFNDLKIFNIHIGIIGILSIFLCFGGDIYLLFKFVNNLFIQEKITEITIVSPQIIAISMIVYFLVGFSEELCFRGILLKLWTNYNKNPKARWIKSTLIISIIFGLVHLVNLSNGLSRANVVYTVTQVLFASMYGVLFAGVMCKTNSIWLCGLIHGTINLLGNSAELFVPMNIMSTIPKELMEQHSALSGIVTIIVVFPGFLWGLCTCKNKDNIGEINETDIKTRD